MTELAIVVAVDMLTHYADTLMWYEQRRWSGRRHGGVPPS